MGYYECCEVYSGVNVLQVLQMILTDYDFDYHKLFGLMVLLYLVEEYRGVKG